MNYEGFYDDLQPQQKNVKDGIASLQRLFKAVSREVEGGDVKNLAKDLETMAQAASAVSEAIDAMKAAADGFDAKEYFESGEFAEQMLAACADKGVDVRGEFPVYEMFPYRVKLDTENQDRKKVQCMRPGSFVDMVKNGQEKLNKASFNAAAFAGELADAYDMAVLKLKRQPGADIYLTSLYKILAPMSRFRTDYDQFGPSRVGGKAIRILDMEGNEQYLATIRFFE